jgi:hypothetical protein
VNFKIKPKRNKKYMEFVRNQECCLTGMDGNDAQSVDPHHEPIAGHGTMGGKPCDSRCVPIAHYLHCEMEDVNSSRRAVWKRYGVDPESVILKMQLRWIENGGKPFWEE